MVRYYFDIRDNSGLAVDDEGLELQTQLEAEIEAAMSLADLAKDFADMRQDVAVEVRTAAGQVFQAAFVFNRSMTRQ